MPAAVRLIGSSGSWAAPLKRPVHATAITAKFGIRLLQASTADIQMESPDSMSVGKTIKVGVLSSAQSVRTRPRKVGTAESHRRPDSGIILLTVLSLLVLLAAVALTVQARALSSTQVLRSIKTVYVDEIQWQSARAVSLPLVGESILSAQEMDEGPVNLDGEVNEVEALGRASHYTVVRSERRNHYLLQRE